MISGSDCFRSCSKRSGERVYIRAFARIIGESAQSCITSLATMLVHGSFAGSGAGPVVGAGTTGMGVTIAGVGGAFNGLEGWVAQAASTIEIASVRPRRVQIVVVRGVLMPGSDPWPA